MILQFGTDDCKVDGFNIIDKDYQMRVSHGYGGPYISFSVHFDGLFFHRFGSFAVVVCRFVGRYAHVYGYRVDLSVCQVQV